jgi:hypothetical protein
MLEESQLDLMREPLRSKKYTRLMTLLSEREIHEWYIERDRFLSLPNILVLLSQWDPSLLFLDAPWGIPIFLSVCRIRVGPIRDRERAE